MVTPVEIWIGGYYHMSGGIRALHQLKQELLNRGVPAWMRYEPSLTRDVIGVYPEIVAGNPEGYQRYVKWLLNKAEFPGEDCWAWETGMGDHPLLTVDIVEKDLWAPYTGLRRGVGYWIGKGAVDPVWLPDGAVEITRQNFPTRPELAAFIRSLDYLISFDPFTAVVLEAVCSGTPVLIRPPKDHQWNRAMIGQHNWTPYGVAWSQEEMEQARRTVGDAFGHYDALRAVFQQRIDEFVDTIQQ